MSEYKGDPETLLEKLFEKAIKNAIKQAKKNGQEPNKLGVVISSEELNNDISVHIQKITPDLAASIFHRFEIVAQSYDWDSLLGAPIMINITTLDQPALSKKAKIYRRVGKIIGRGLKKGRRLLNWDRETSKGIKKKSLLLINNTDMLCLFHALEITRLYMSKELPSQRFSDMTIERIRSEYVLPLLKKLAIPSFLIEYDIEKYGPIIQEYYNEVYPGKYKIFVFNSPSSHIYETETTGYEIPLCLHYDQKLCHFDGIRSIQSYFGKKCYCFTCRTTYEHAIKHTSYCKSRCRNCCRIGPKFPCKKDEKFNGKKCIGCNKFFDSEECYEYHLKRDREYYNTVCELSKKCDKCFIYYHMKCFDENTPEHICGNYFCQKCRTYRPKEHDCYIVKLKIPRAVKDYRIVVIDFECTQCTKFEENPRRFEHFPNHICARILCTRCIRNDRWMEEMEDCEICGRYRTIVWSCVKSDKTQLSLINFCENPLVSFLDWLFGELSNKFKSIVFAHFGGRYDICFIYACIFDRYRLKPEIIKNGNRLIELTVPKQGEIPETRFRDSWNLITISLDKFQKTFGLEEDKEKEFFPHLYNNPKNYGTLRKTLPEKYDYLCSTFSADKFKIFEKFYEENKNNNFCLDDALFSYCLSDVNILADGLVAMRKEYYKITSLDLFESITLASAVMRHYRINHMPENILAVCPELGWDPKWNQSKIAISFLKWIAHKESVQIQTAESAEGEFKIPGTNFRVDGYVKREGKNDLIIEIYGDIWHGCPHHFDNPEALLPTGFSVREQRWRDQERENIIRDNGFDLDTIWECEIREQLKEDMEMKEFFDQCFDSGPIRLRNEAFFGGRTGPLKMYQMVQPGYRIAMVDFCSLYPSVNYYGDYPVKHPQWKVYNKVVNWSREEENHVKGFLKCRVLAPKNLKIPVLPVKFDDGRLLFTLCRMCSLKYPKGARLKNYHCDHNATDRSFVVTQTHLEINAALRAGYKVLDLYRTLEFDQFEHNLFKSYVREFLKLKMEASGWPSDDPTERQKFLDENKEIYGITLEPEKIEANPGLRFIAKQALNSLWGRFALRQRISKCEVVDDPEALEFMLHDYRNDVTQIDHMNDEEILVTYTPLEEFTEENNTCNILVACWTTSMARLKLLDAMQKVAAHPKAILLYHDTDSLLYMYPIGDNPLETGTNLGDLMEEYKEYIIVEFISGGSKAYALKMLPKNDPNAEPVYVIKCRGITMDVNTAKVFHYEAFKQKVMAYGDPTDEPLLIDYPHKLMVKKARGVQTHTDYTKRYQCVVQKGITLDHSLEIVPFGFCDRIDCDCWK